MGRMAASWRKDLKALGLDEDCSVAQLKSAFRRRAKLCHPDLAGQGGQEFAGLRESYRRLLELLEKRDERSRGARAPGSRRAAQAAPAPRAAPAKRAYSKPHDAQALKSYREAMAAFESFQSVNRDRSIELKFLHSLTKKGIALVDLHRFLRLLDQLEKSAGSALLLFREALERDSGQAWAADAREKIESLERQLARCVSLKAEVSGGTG
jgi:hypothetical protein